MVQNRDPGPITSQFLTGVNPIATPQRIDMKKQRDADALLGGISFLITKGEENAIKTGHKELLESYQKFAFDRESAAKYLNAIGTLMKRQSELSIVSREEVEKALEDNDLDDEKVILLFEEVAQLQARRAEIGNASRDEIKAMLTLAWDVDERLQTTERALLTYRTLMADDSHLMSLFANGVGEDERKYLRDSILRFGGESEASMGYLKKVADILAKGESLGWPSRELVVEQLNTSNLDARKATQAIREEYHAKRDLELKAEYEKKRAAQGKAS